MVELEQFQAPVKTVSIKPLKEWILRNAPTDSKLRQLILSEKETMTADEFISKLESWRLLAVNERS